MNENDDNKIENIKSKLYDPNDKVVSHRSEGVLHKISYDAPLEWKNPINTKKEDDMKNNNKKPPFSIFKKFFIVSVIFFIGALGFAFYKFQKNDSSVSSDKIDILVIGNSFTKGGEELPLQIEITNNNNSNLELVNLIIEYPSGSEDNATDIVRLPRESIGTVAPGENVIRNIKVKLFGAEKSIRNIKVSLEYHPQGSNAVFSKEIYYPVTISLAPLSLNIEAQENTTSNQSISLKVSAVLNTSLPGENPVLQLSYPNNFVFDSAIPAPTMGNSIWDLSNISISNPINIEINGRIVGQEGDQQVFHAYAGTTNGTNQSKINIIYSSVLHKIAIAKPFLDANILIGDKDQDEYVVSGGKNVTVVIPWSNNLSTRITDAQIIASLSGNVFDKNKVSSINGFYDSANSQIIWDKNGIEGLSEINPGETGSVSFNFTPMSLIGISDIKNPKVSIKVSIKGRQPQLGSTFKDVNNFSEKIVKVVSDFQIASSASYISGSLPPKAETETRYKITWTLSNSSNGISEAQARSVLPIYINWVGKYGDQEDVTYNEVTREVVWNIGQVLPNTGIDSNREASFILSLKPSLSQAESIPQLTKDLYLSGKDVFTNTVIKSNRGPITTSSSGSNGRVVK